jgi:methylglyoxal synthase
MGSAKEITLVAHNCKTDHMVGWADFNKDALAHHTVFATGTTGLILEPKFRSG